MTHLHSLTIDVDKPARDAALASFRSIAENLAALDGSGERVVDLFSRALDGGNDAGDLFLVEPVVAFADGAAKDCRLQILPGEPFLEAVTALAVEREDVSLSFSHGWPILSVGDRTPTVDRKGRGASLSPDGAL